MKVYIEIDENVRYYEQDNSDPPDEDHDIRFVVASLSKLATGDLRVFSIEESAKVGDPVYVIYVAYDTGNSLFRQNNMKEIVEVTNSFDRAEFVTDFIEKIERDKTDLDRDYFYVKIPASHGVDEYSLHAFWRGYFEDFNHCDYETLTLRK